MRQVLIAVAVLSGAGAAGAQQRVVTHGPGMAPAMAGGARHHDWGGRTGGYWTGGLRAPGGYRAYHRPVRGYALPTYWLAPGFLIDDWAAYGLTQPYGGYHWSRYYDDAVLIDDRGSVYDSVEGVDWDRGERGGEAYAGGPGADFPPPGAGYPPPGAYPHRDAGVGGAVAGAAVGGAVGAIAGGRHERLGGALIGAGAGALAGYAIDRGGERRRERMAPPPHGAGYPPPPDGGYAEGGYPPRSPYPPAPGYPRQVVVPGGTTTTVTTTSVGGYAGYGGTWVNGVYYGPGVTTVTVQSAPVVTTTTTETIEDSVTYTRPVVRRVYVKRTWHPRGKLQCRCGQ